MNGDGELPRAVGVVVTSEKGPHAKANGTLRSRCWR